MAVGVVWTNPATYPNPDLHTGDVITQTAWQLILSNLNAIGGSDGKTPTLGLMMQISDSTRGTDGTFSFTSIPGTFKHLLVIATGRSDQAAAVSDVGMRFNNDSGGNYDYEWSGVNNTSASNNGGQGQTSALVGLAPGTSTTRGSMAGSIVIFVPGYAGTTFEKGFVALSASVDSTAANSWLLARGGSWRSTSAITRLDLGTNGFANNFKTSSRATLYGIN